jgi:hypothetical protein
VRSVILVSIHFAEIVAMVTALVLALSAPAAPVPPPPPPVVEVAAKRAVHPPVLVDLGGGKPQLVNIDDGHYVEVTVKNVSRDALSLTYHYGLEDLVYAKVTDAKGREVSDPGHRFAIRSLQFQPKTMKLGPGDSFTVHIHLHGSIPDDGKKPGKYTARAVLQFEKLRAESAATFELEIK